MPLSRRYSPEWAPGETSTIGLDYSGVIPPGVGIAAANLVVQSNVVAPINASGDFVGTIDPKIPGAFQVSVSGRSVYVQLQGGVNGKDYQFVWTATDTVGNVWPRTALLLCAPTS